MPSIHLFPLSILSLILILWHYKGQCCCQIHVSSLFSVCLVALTYSKRLIWIVNTSSQTQFETLCSSFKISWQWEWSVFYWTENEKSFHAKPLFCKGKMGIALGFNMTILLKCRGPRTLITITVLFCILYFIDFSQLC